MDRRHKRIQQRFMRIGVLLWLWIQQDGNAWLRKKSIMAPP
jgi:hypothetical protein